jgi:hypothetical protein
MDQPMPGLGQPLLPQQQLLSVFNNSEDKNAVKDVRDILSIDIGAEKK